MLRNLTLVSHHLCPYVQRAVIALTEKRVPFERKSIDLSRKPAWFTRLSPLGKVPVLITNGHAVFESAVILEYLEETQPPKLHPADALRRAEHRSWIEFGSAILNDIAGFYSAPDQKAFERKRSALSARFGQIEQHVSNQEWFDPVGFSLVDAVYGPIFRYFDTFDTIADFGIIAPRSRVAQWRANLKHRASVAQAVGPDYHDSLITFLAAKDSHLSGLMKRRGH